MSAMPCGIGAESLHDRIVEILAQRWARMFPGRVIIDTCLDPHRWAWVDQKADIMVWLVSPYGHSVYWIAEVETGESLCAPDAPSKWQRGAALGMPFLLFVPSGGRTFALHSARLARVALSGVYEYRLASGTVEFSSVMGRRATQDESLSGYDTELTG